MIYNIKIIKEILNFTNEHDFYMIYIIRRKKDQKGVEENKSAKVIKSYCINSIIDLEEKYDEIKTLCNIFNARAYIYINKKNHKNIGLMMIKLISDRLISNQFNQQFIFDKVFNQSKKLEKRWIIDIDTHDINHDKKIQEFINNKCKPIGMKIIANIPTKQGHHLITHPFNLEEFKKEYPTIDIHKDNPTILYYP